MSVLPEKSRYFRGGSGGGGGDLQPPLLPRLVRLCAGVLSITPKISEDSIRIQMGRSVLACVASVSVRFGSKELQRENGASKTKRIFHFSLSPHFPRGQNTKNPVPCSQTPRKRLLRRLGPSRFFPTGIFLFRSEY